MSDSQISTPAVVELARQERLLRALSLRRKNKYLPQWAPKSLVQASLPIRFYCISCSYPSDSLPLDYDPLINPPRQLCEKCQELADLGLLRGDFKYHKILLRALKERKENPPEKIDDSKLRAGSPMHFYCGSCGHQSDQLPEDWNPRDVKPKKLCVDCQTLNSLGLLDPREL